MKKFFAYARVSTVKQGEKGSSLQEQKSAIEGYANRQGIMIVEWFEETETAAKQGRPVFTRMVRALQQGGAAGVITHKIDRSARNLRDWAMLGELVDRGIELHFAHESIDLTSRGGRLSADIQAVVAADYIRNLRDEVRKGFYGRLKQGLYPLKAPIGYLDQGGGKPKTIDPVRGPLVQKAFELYATGNWSFDTLGWELHQRGLRNNAGGIVTRNGLSTILNSPFYIGLIRLSSNGELYQGVHEPLISKVLFDRVQAVLQGRFTHKANIHRFRFQRVLRCATCGRSLVASRAKGHVYYRCATRTCGTTSLRQELIEEGLQQATRPFRLTERQWIAVQGDLRHALAHHKKSAEAEKRSLTLSITAIDERLARLTDAYIDQVVDRTTYLSRKEQLLHDRTLLVSRQTTSDAPNFPDRVQKSVELIKALGNLAILANDEELRDLLKITVSNLTASGKNVAITWENPFRRIILDASVTAGEPNRIEHRTFQSRIKRIVSAIIAHAESGPGESQN